MGKTILLFVTLTISSVFAQDITNKLGNNGVFKITNSGGTNEYFRVSQSNGYLGLGTSSPTANLTVLRGGTVVTPGYGTTLLVQNNATTISNSRIGIISGSDSYGMIDFGDADAVEEGGIEYWHSLNMLSFRTNNTQHRMVISSSGNVGIGTTSPTEKLEVNGNITVGSATDVVKANRIYGIAGDFYIHGSSNSFKVIGSGGTSDVKLTVDGLNGGVGIGTTTPNKLLQIYSTAGASMSVQTNSVADTASWIYLGNDVDNTVAGIGLGTSGYTRYGGAYSLNIYNRVSAPITFLTDASEKMRITSSGNVGIGTTTPDNKLVVYNGSTTGRYTTTGWTHSSDIRLKHDVITLNSSLQKVKQLRGVSFKFNNDPAAQTQIGFIAQEVEKVYPEVVVTGDDGYKSVAYSNLVAALVEAMKEQQKEIEQLKNQLSSSLTANSETSELKSQVEQLVKKVNRLYELQPENVEIKPVSY
jgi:trimeric autotransporter adhesin